MPNATQKSQNLTLNRRTSLVIAAVLLLVLGGVYFALRNSASTNPSLPLEVSVTEAADLRTDGAFILDVRLREEWDQQHIEGATLIPLGELPNRLKEVPQDKPIVVVCRSGNRSAQARDILLKSGFRQVTSMKGGIRDWMAAGLSVVTGQ